MNLRSFNKSTLSLLCWITVLLLVSSLMGQLTHNSMGTWYAQLARSPLTPPGPVFGIVWTLLYVMIAIAGWQLWKQPGITTQKSLFITQMILNWMWTPLFFYLHLVGCSLLCLIVLTIAILCLIATTYQRQKKVALLLMPYAVWSCFACYLNTYIWMHIS